MTLMLGTLPCKPGLQLGANILSSACNKRIVQKLVHISYFVYAGHGLVAEVLLTNGHPSNAFLAKDGDGEGLGRTLAQAAPGKHGKPPKT